MFSLFSNTNENQPHSENAITTECKFMHPPDHPSNFGILRLIISQLEAKITKMNWIFNIDRSGSMCEVCSDGKN